MILCIKSNMGDYIWWFHWKAFNISLSIGRFTFLKKMVLLILHNDTIIVPTTIISSHQSQEALLGCLPLYKMQCNLTMFRLTQSRKQALVGAISMNRFSSIHLVILSLHPFTIVSVLDKSYSSSWQTLRWDSKGECIDFSEASSNPHEFN